LRTYSFFEGNITQIDKWYQGKMNRPGLSEYGDIHELMPWILIALAARYQYFDSKDPLLKLAAMDKACNFVLNFYKRKSPSEWEVFKAEVKAERYVIPRLTVQEIPTCRTIYQNVRKRFVDDVFRQAHRTNHLSPQLTVDELVSVVKDKEERTLRSVHDSDNYDPNSVRNNYVEQKTRALRWAKKLKYLADELRRLQAAAEQQTAIEQQAAGEQLDAGERKKAKRGAGGDTGKRHFSLMNHTLLTE
jgi:hypothetical protein